MKLEKSLNFLSLVKENNYKEWFHANKPLYDEAKSEFEGFVNNLIKEVYSIDKEIGYPEPKNCIFRIFRDIRFSPDKTPYKSNFGVFLAKGGSRKSEYGGYYFHLEPGNCMLAGGIWMPQPDILKAVREEIYHNIDEFLAIINSPNFKKHFGEIDYDSVLKNAPRDYPKDWPHIEYLKFKSYTVSKATSEEMMRTGEGLMKEVHDVYNAMAPLNHFFNRVIEDLR
jgi:uncharacterized protein (TIGR02453 family)